MVNHERLCQRIASLLVGLVSIPGAFGIMLSVRVESEDDKSGP